jgi:hypothetical protein
MQGSLRALGVVPESAAAIEDHTRELLAALSAHFAAQPFLLGTRPSLADCALMGPLFAHLSCDAVPGRLLRETAPAVCAFVERMNGLDAGAVARGAFLPGDALAPTLRPLLALVGRDAAPLHQGDQRAAEAWALEHAEAWEAPPRVLGFHRTALRGAAFDRYTSAYAPFMVQRPLDAFQALSPAERDVVLRAVAGTGLEPLLGLEPRVRVAKRGFALVYTRAATDA